VWLWTVPGRGCASNNAVSNTVFNRNGAQFWGRTKLKGLLATKELTNVIVRHRTKGLTVHLTSPPLPPFPHSCPNPIVQRHLRTAYAPCTFRCKVWTVVDGCYKGGSATATCYTTDTVRHVVQDSPQGSRLYAIEPCSKPWRTGR